MKEIYTVGQEVAYNTSRNYFSSCFIRFGKIKKITKTGIITLENGARFNSFGKELKSDHNSFPSSNLVDISQAKKMIERQEIQNNSRKKIQELKDKLDNFGRNKILTKDQLEKINAAIAWL
jgi:hypothetical protein